MIGTAAALVLPGLVNYAIMEGALRLRDARYVKWSDAILTELKECVQGFIDYGRYVHPEPCPLGRSFKLICPHGIKAVPLNPLCNDEMCNSLQLKGIRALSRISDQEASYNANLATTLLALALTVSAAVCTILFLLPTGLNLLPLAALRLAAVGISLMGAFLPFSNHQHSRLLAGMDKCLPMETLARAHLAAPKAKRLVYTPDMIREINLGVASESDPGYYQNVSIVLEVDGITYRLENIPMGEPGFLILQEALSKEVLSQIPANDLQHTDLAREGAEKLREQGANSTSILSGIIVYALGRPR